MSHTKFTHSICEIAIVQCNCYPRTFRKLSYRNQRSQFNLNLNGVIFFFFLGGGGKLEKKQKKHVLSNEQQYAYVKTPLFWNKMFCFFLFR